MKLFKTALAAALMAPLFAQAQATVFGVMDVGYVNESGGPAGSVNKITGGIASGSRFGLRGEENLGGGMSAIFTLEGGINADVGSSGQGGLLFGRQAFTGIKGNFGTIMLGRQYTPHGNTGPEMDPMNAGLAGSYANMLSSGGVGGSNRVDNAIKYRLPGDLGGFNGEVTYGVGEVVGNADARRQYGFIAGYASGPLSVKLTYNNLNDANGTNPSEVTWISGKYDFGVLTAFLTFAKNSNAQVFGVVNADTSDVMAGVSVPVGRGRFLASYIDKKDNTSASRNANQVALAYLYSMSKTVSLFTSWARIDNGNVKIVVNPGNVGNSGYRAGNATEQGSGNEAYNFGMRYAF